MKVTVLFLVFIVSFMFWFFVLSAVGILWLPYEAIITNAEWFLIYTLFFGWWLAGFPARSYYIMHEKYFDRL